MSPSNIEILAYEESPLGPLCLRRRELLAEPGTVVTEITLNHAFLMSSYNTESERALAQNALSIHGAGAASGSAESLRVLIGGLGLGYTAEAVLLSSRVARVDVIELLPQVIDWMAQGLVPLADVLNEDPRFHPLLGDVYATLTGAGTSVREAEGAVTDSNSGPASDSNSGPTPISDSGSASDSDSGPTSGSASGPTPGPASVGGSASAFDPDPGCTAAEYDLILIDVDHSPDDRLGGDSEAFYTAAGLTAAKSCLARGGVLGIWSYAESSPFSDALREVFENVQVVPVRFMNKLVDREEVDWLFFAT